MVIIISPKLNNIKAIFLDIDGTLYNSKKQVTEYTKRVLNKLTQEGIHVVLSSGRQCLDVCEISKGINVSKYVIACNGAFVYDYAENIGIFKSTMRKEDIKEIWKLCEEGNMHLILEGKKERYINFEVNLHKYIEINGIEEIQDQEIFQVVIDNLKVEDTKNVKKGLIDNEYIWSANYGVSYYGNYFFDINNKNIDKGIGIKELIKYLGIKKEETMGFGDGINDYAMFRECGIGVAMGNAGEELKKMADYVALTNDEDGIAKFVEKYIL